MFIFCVLGILKWWLKSSVQWYTYIHMDTFVSAQEELFVFKAAVCL